MFDRLKKANPVTIDILAPKKYMANRNRFFMHCNNRKCNIRGDYFSVPLKETVNEWKEWDEYKPKQNKKWYKCKACRMVWYCSRKCQKYDWNHES
eukprot:281040_1